MSEINKLDVCYASSDEFSIHTGISLLSLLDNNQGLVGDVYILDYGIKDDNKARLDSICSDYGVTCKYIYAKTLLINIGKKTGINNFRDSFATYSRAFLDMILPEDIDRILYIDSDTVVTGCIKGLFDFDMSGKVIAGTANCNFYPIRKDKKDRSPELDLISNNTLYIHCGILLYSLKNWRKMKCTEKIFETCTKMDGFRFADQTLINNALDESLFGMLPLTYDASMHNFCDKYNLRLYRGGGFYSDEEIWEALKNPIIVHYCGGPLQRPWYSVCVSRQRFAYYRYKKMSPWKDVPAIDYSDHMAKMTSGERKKLKIRMAAMKCNNAFLARVITKIRFFVR